MSRTAARVRRGISRRGLLATSGAAAATAFLAACGSDDGDVPAALRSTAPSSGTSSAGSGGPASIPSEFVVANEAEPNDLGPFVGGGYSTWLVTAQIYETLAEPRLSINQRGSVDVSFTPHLAESWERPDPLRWRMRLRAGVTFHNGEPWNAAAAKFSFDTLADANQASALNKVSYLSRTMVGCEIVDDMTVDFITKQPDEETLRSTLRIGFVGLPPKLVQEKGVQSLLEHPVGTGPYAFKSWTRGQDIQLQRFANHWSSDGPNMPAVKYIVRKEAAVRAQTVKSGEAHFAYNIGAEQAQGIENAVVGGGFQSSGIRLNNTHPVTGDIRVRRALNMAVDRNAIVKSIFRGAATPIAFFGFQPVTLAPFEYKPEEAKKLIDAAGVKGTQLEFVYGEGRIPEEDQLAEIYKAAFDDIGLRINLKKLEPRQYNELGGKPFPEQPPLYMETTSSGNYGEIASGLNDKYGCKGTGTFCKPEYDAEYAALAAMSGEERNKKLQSIAERLHNEEAPRVWVVAVQQVHGFAGIVKPNLPANAYILFEDIKVG